MINIKTYKFNQESVEKIRKAKYGEKWPVVYIIRNNKEAYIGETTNAYMRVKQHLRNERKRKLKNITIISNEEFNKSVILDLEAFLIKYMSADGKYILQNGNNGLQFHNYFQMERYQIEFEDIWQQLKEKKFVKNNPILIENFDLFKYSPYKALTDDQYESIREILSELSINIKQDKKCTFLVNGEPGTGKTILAMYIIKLITEIKDKYTIIEEKDLNKDSEYKLELDELPDNLKIGIVIPTDNLRATIKKVFRKIDGLNPKMVLSPNEATKDTYDLLIVDEAHRLRRRKNLTQYETFDKNNEKFGLGKEGTELDWIRKCSKYQILFYDKNQTIKPTDVRRETFKEIANDKNNYVFNLYSQLRCKGGNDYIKYIKSIFSDNPPTKKINFCNKDYEFYLYDNVKEMTEAIKDKDRELGLCRNFAGYSWKWITKGKSLEEIKEKQLYDIEINGYKYIWNSTRKDFIHSDNAINEIGCIHTSQGYDLNYAGVILGNEIKYDKINKKIFIDKSQYFDTKGKSDIQDENELKKYILNIYTTMMTRGIKGTYIYACDKDLREYLAKYISKR